MRKLIVAFLFAALPGLSVAASEGYHLDTAPIDLHDKAALQNGAKLFVNYCLSCHGAAYMRYSRMGNDLGFTDEQVRENLMFATDKIGEQMKVAMPKADAKRWFGNPPPDLSVIARARGADYLYTYLRTFYVDEKRPFGVNNPVFPDVGMPHVLWELQGLQRPVYEKDAAGHEAIVGFEPVSPGKLSSAEYDKAAADLTNFLVYMAEPVRTERERLGWWVLGFLLILLVVSYLLKKEYWRDIH